MTSENTKSVDDLGHAGYRMQTKLDAEELDASKLHKRLLQSTVRILQNRFGILQHRVRLLQSRGILQNRERKVGGTSKQSIHSVPFNFATRGNLWPKQNH